VATGSEPVTRSLFVASVFVLGTAGCGPAPAPKGIYSVIGGDPHSPKTVPDVGQVEWTVSRERLTHMRAGLPRRPYVAKVQVGVVDPRSGDLFRARGAVAVSPERAARLILVGPAGTTALDLWVTPDRFRFSIPSIHLEKRGGRDLEGARGLPIGFLRWWFLSPLHGELMLARSSDAESAFLLRDGAATITVRTDGERSVAVRREGDRLEGLEWSGRGVGPEPGARGRYIEGEWGMRVLVLIEEVLAEEPDPASLFDPDDQGTPL
jgi:hypothetical protein